MTELRVETLTIPGARLGDENPLPFFRDPAVDTDIKAHASLPPEKRELLGSETAFRVLPYRVQDAYSRQREPLAFRSVVLENETLRATFLPELGGRLISLFYKPLERELLHRNPVFQPANLAIRNAWFSGGIEWNIGQFGHTFTTCAPVFAGAIEDASGQPGLRLYEFERSRGLFWQIDFYLPAGLPFLAAYTRVINPAHAPTSMYWWTNVAVDEAPDVRVLAPASQAIYVDFGEREPVFGCTSLPGLPSLNGGDGTYALNSTFANEFFFQCDGVEMPWEAALDGRGRGFVEASTRRLKYRKLFVWGSHAGGRHWQEFLSQPGQAYLEIQAGLAPTQVHGLVMPAHASWDWTQVFGYVEADPAQVHGADWPAAWGAVDAAIKEKLSPEQLRNLEATCQERAELPSNAMIQHGAGWGALEQARRAKQPCPGLLPASFFFPAETLGPEQKKWLALLKHGDFPDPAPEEMPGEWMTQEEWRELLEASLQDPTSRGWYALLHLGVMRMEALDEAGAAEAWEESIRIQPSLWAFRNLAVLKLRQKDVPAALELYERAWQIALQGGALFTALAVEYLQILVDTGQFTRGQAVLDALPEGAREADRVQILRGKIALELGDLEAVEQVLQREYAGIREGETMLTDLWFELQARKQAAESQQPLTPQLRQRVKAECKPPARIDFRSFNER